MRYWYSLTEDDIHAVADEMEVKLSRSQMKKIKELASEYIDWFYPIEEAIKDISMKSADV